MPRDSDRGPHDWSPYNNRVEFELADFLFQQNQMSAGDINSLLNIWAATLAPHCQRLAEYRNPLGRSKDKTYSRTYGTAR